MNEIPFQLVLKVLAYVGDESAVRRLTNGQLVIPATTVKAVMRRHLRELIVEQRIDPKLEAEIFGEIRDSYAIRSRFSVSTLLASGIAKSVKSVPAGTRFTGKLLPKVPQNSIADFAIRLSLMAIQSLRGSLACAIEFSDGSMLAKPFYKLPEPQGVGNARELQQLVDGLLISYFRSHPDKFYLMEPRKFEEFVASMLRSEGFEVELTPITRDSGFDILAVKHSAVTGRHTYLVECKRYSKHRKVGIEIIRNLMWVVQKNYATKGMIITTASFSKETCREAANYSSRIMLHDYDSLKNWINGLKL